MSYQFEDGKPPRESSGALNSPYKFEDEEAPGALDVAKAALIGFVPDTAKAIGYGLEKAGVDYGTRMRRAGADVEADIVRSMTPGGRRAFETPVFEGEGLTDPHPTDKWGQSLLMGAARSGPQSIMMAPIGGP